MRDCNGWLVGSNSKSRIVQESRIYINTAFILHGAAALIPWLHVMFRKNHFTRGPAKTPNIYCHYVSQLESQLRNTCKSPWMIHRS